MGNWLIGSAALALAAPVGAQTAAPATPLFASDAPINLVIRGPINSLASKRSENARPGTLTLKDTGASFPIMLTPRGITRKMSNICSFPPLRVEFPQRPPAGTLFEGQGRLKLVTHCKGSADFQQKVLLEYAAYRLYNAMTPLSFRARLANIDYVDDSGRPVTSRVGFFIEDIDDVARRNGVVKANTGAMVPLAQIEPSAGARFAVFNYMIGNLDWSMRAGPPEEGCCHNGRLVAAPGATQYQPVPYDFDFSGLVDAPYATPPEGIKVNNVRQRLYRGYCAHNAHSAAFAAATSAKRTQLIGILASIPGMEPKTQAKAASYLEGFFKDLDSGKLLKTCIG
ncbi:hypothetical protein H9L13_05595 [Sphingomonas lutea]|uniref:Uncharacterized protein n=1 Tax=Sphingomonas lutea TaxID=1045317 RepID=A0A7G9SKG2_9SPHN|nr:hypothetical protein [Sphingomonas lutea]QNN68337.1 hypothetical protein H9L13_05595 [Sphingomonas lutea]